MIRIQNASDVEQSFFAPRDFTGSIATVQQIISDVKARGDEALFEYCKKFDDVSISSLLISQDDLKEAREKLQNEHNDIYNALIYSYDLALRFAKEQRKSFNDFEIELEQGLFTGQKTIAVDKAGVYVPAGRFPLVSSVIMTVAPARAAGVNEIILCTPPKKHPQKSNAPYADEKIMAAASICGISKVYACGGSQAIAAMAFGSKSIPQVDVIVGPGNKFVAAAKKEVYGTVGIDMLAGPTEVFIIADSSANPTFVAADLLAQAEHDADAQPILATTDKELAKKVAEEIENQLKELSTSEIARASIEKFGKIIITETLEQAATFANKKAPEHLEIAMEDSEERNKIINKVHNYGSLFIGHYAAEVLGDYAAGLNHTLPTSSSARFTGGLSVRSFLKTVTTLRANKNSEGLKNSAKAASCIGDAEGLSAHAKAARIRL